MELGSGAVVRERDPPDPGDPGASPQIAALIEDSVLEIHKKLLQIAALIQDSVPESRPFPEPVIVC